MKIVSLPDRLTASDSYLLIKAVESIERDPEVDTVDASGTSRFEPFGVAILAQAFLKRRAAGLSGPTLVRPTDQNAREFLAEVEFARFVNATAAVDPPGYLAVRKFSTLDVSFLDSIAKFLVGHVPGTTEDGGYQIRLCLTELLQNVFEWAGSGTGAVVHSRWFAAEKNLKLAVVDGGIGIPEALRREFPERGHESDDALVVAAVTEEGLTSRRGKMGGVGLKLIREIATAEGGQLTVVSYDAKVVFKRGGKIAKPKTPTFRGTAIEMDFRPHVETQTTNPIL